MKLNDDQMQRQMDYSATIHALLGLKNQGILTEDDFIKARALFIEKYHPLIQVIS